MHQNRTNYKTTRRYQRINIINLLRTSPVQLPRYSHNQVAIHQLLKYTLDRLNNTSTARLLPNHIVDQCSRPCQQYWTEVTYARVDDLTHVSVRRVAADQPHAEEGYDAEYGVVEEYLRGGELGC